MAVDALISTFLSYCQGYNPNMKEMAGRRNINFRTVDKLLPLLIHPKGPDYTLFKLYHNPLEGHRKLFMGQNQHFQIQLPDTTVY